MGSCTVSRSGGPAVAIKIGDLVGPSDVIETSAGGRLSIRFTDGTTFTLSDKARMALKDYVGDERSAFADIDRGTFSFIAGRMAEAGRLSIQTPFASIRARRNGGGIGMLSLISLFFAAFEEAQAAPSDVAFLDDGKITSKDLGEYGVVELLIKATATTPEQVKFLDDPGETIVIRSSGSSVSVDSVTNSIAQMAQYQAAQQEALHTFSVGLQQGQGPTGNGSTGSSTPPPPEFIPPPQNINFVPDNNPPPNFTPPPGPPGIPQNNNSEPPPLGPPPPPPPPPAPGLVVEREHDTGDPTPDTTTGTLSGPGVSAGTPTFVWSNGALTPGDQSNLAAASTLSFTGSGPNDFTFHIPDQAVDFLAAGETLTVTYNVTIAGGGTEQAIITVFGTEDAPKLAADVSGPHATTELPNDKNDSTPDQTAPGTLTFTDVDLNDTHTVSSSLVSATWSGGATLPSGLSTVLASALSLTLHDSTPSQTGAGSIDFTFSAADKNFDFLAQGETLTVTYNVTVMDNFGATSTKAVTITINGSEDAPVITSGAQAGSATEIGDNLAGENVDIHHSSGTVTFNDVDLSDIETQSITNTQVSAVLAHGYALTVAQQNTLVNAFTLDAATHSQADGTGTVGWHYDIADSALDFLGADDVVTLTYTVQVADGHGGTASQDVTITVHGTEDAPTITSAVQAGSATEIGDNLAGENTDIHHSSGAVTFNDVDLSDLETSSIANTQVSAVLAHGYALTAAQQNALVNAFTIGAASHSNVTGNGSIGWHYDIADSDLDFLGANDVVTLTYTVQVADGHGGTASQDVTITVHGTEDKPVITSGAQSGSATEIGDLQPGENTDIHHSSGTVTFQDVDLSDSETSSSTLKQLSATLANSYSLTAAQHDALVNAFTVDAATHSSTTGNGIVNWHYDIADSDLDFLGAHDQVVLTFTVKVDDGNGGTASQDVTVTVHGSEDKPTIAATSNSFSELAGTNNPNTDSVGGTISFTDVDASDRPTVSAPFDHYSYLAADGTTALTLTAIQQTDLEKALVIVPAAGNTDNGSATWTYSVADKALDFLAQGETLTFTYIGTVDDHQTGGVVTQPITVTIHGTNDAPVIKLDGTYSLDQFITQDYGPWIEQGNNSNGAVNGSPFNGEFQLVHDPASAAGDFQARLTDLDAESDVPDTLTRTFNLANAGTTAKVEFDYRRDIPSGQTDDKFDVLVSINGGAFVSIGNIGATGNGSFVDGSYLHFSFDISSPVTINSVAVQFSVGDNVDDGDIVYVDNIKLSYATSAGATQTINYAENSAVGILPPQITDADHNATIHSATLHLTNHQANDLLSVTGDLPGTIHASAYDATTGVLTLTGTASLADYQTALSHIIFSNTSDNPDTTDRTLTVTVNDGLADSNVATETIHVTAIDDLPFATADNVITNFGIGTQFQIPTWALLANDQDLDNPLNITSVTGATSGSASLGAGTVNFNDSPPSGGSFNYTATGGSLTTTAQVTITQDTSGPMDGTSGDDILIAKPATAVTMNGGSGNDVLIGNTGSQIMNGGPGSDTFVFKTIADSTPAAFDTIQDFTPGTDHLDFTTIAGTTNLHQLATAAEQVAANSISWFKDGSQTIVYVNSTANPGHVDMEIHLTGANVNLTGSDILHHT